MWIVASFPPPPFQIRPSPCFSLTIIVSCVLFCVISSSHLFFHSHVSPPVGAGCARRPSSISLTCRSTPNRTQRPNLTSVLTVTSHSPTPATWPSTSVSTAGPSPTPAPTARNLSGNSVIYSSTHGTSDETTRYCSLVPRSCVCSPAKFFWKPKAFRSHFFPLLEDVWGICMQIFVAKCWFLASMLFGFQRSCFRWS